MEEITAAAISNTTIYESKSEKTKDIAYVLIVLILLVQFVIYIKDRFFGRKK